MQRKEEKENLYKPHFFSPERRKIMRKRVFFGKEEVREAFRGGALFPVKKPVQSHQQVRSTLAVSAAFCRTGFGRTN